MSVRLPLLKLSWSRSTQNKQKKPSGSVLLPVYLNGSRRELLFTIPLPTSLPEKVIYQRGVALVTSNLKGI